MQLVILGTGAGGGVPSHYCDCIACQEAALEPRYRRTRCAVAILGEQTTLIDAPPDLRHQLVDQGIDQIDHFLLTHTHYDHTGGLGDLEFYIRLARKEALPTYLTRTSWVWLQSTFGYMEDCFSPALIEGDWTVSLDGVRYSALAVTHASGTVGFLLEKDGRRTAYLPDTGPLPEDTMEKLAGVDTLILGATFWGQNWMLEDHLSVAEAVQIGLELEAKQVYLTHLSMHYDVPVTNRELTAYLESFGKPIRPAYDGLRINL
ncbi:MBL fold metallo-hydrolase [bacterium]|nr:MBL fold metallo-hydrolase [bacterium]